MFILWNLSLVGIVIIKQRVIIFICITKIFQEHVLHNVIWFQIFQLAHWNAPDEWMPFFRGEDQLDVFGLI